MAIAVVVRDELGRTVARLEDATPYLPMPQAAVTERLLPLGRHEAYPMLGYVDPYGDTCFNRAQARALLAELRAWDEEMQTEASRALLAGMTVLAEAHMSRPHRYLWFIGA